MLDTSRLTERTEEELLKDFAGTDQGAIKMMNLIYSFFRALEEAGAIPPAKEE